MLITCNTKEPCAFLRFYFMLHKIINYIYIYIYICVCVCVCVCTYIYVRTCYTIKFTGTNLIRVIHTMKIRKSKE